MRFIQRILRRTGVGTGILSILYVRFVTTTPLVQNLISSSFNSLCEILHCEAAPATDICRQLSILYVRFKVLKHVLSVFLAVCPFNSLCEIPTPFLTPFIGLKGDLSLSKRGCTATPQLASGYIKG